MVIIRFDNQHSWKEVIPPEDFLILQWFYKFLLPETIKNIDEVF